MMTQNEFGESVRGFRVIVKAAENRRFGLGEKQFILPPSGFPLYTGEKALAVMRAYGKRRLGVTVTAQTEDKWSGVEFLRTGEMEALYGDEVTA